MTLRKYTGGVAGDHYDTSIALAFDANYAGLFRALVRSMVEQETLLDCPIIIYSADPEVFEDPLVAKIVDKRRLIDPAQQKILEKASRDTVKRPERATWNLGTFLKWAAFEKQETSQLLFLDVDMIFKKPAEELLSLRPDVKFLCAPQFQRSIMESEDPAAGMQKLIDGDMWGNHSWRVNSGMMLIRDDLLSDAFREELLLSAFSAPPRINEQSHMSVYFSENPGLHAMVSAKYNFQEGFVRHAPPEAQPPLTDQAVILHYAGGIKPWKTKKHELRPSQREWFRYADEVAA